VERHKLFFGYELVRGNHFRFTGSIDGILFFKYGVFE
jgi:hypothetical protein